jgi:hypothetical protein
VSIGSFFIFYTLKEERVLSQPAQWWKDQIIRRNINSVHGRAGKLPYTNNRRAEYEIRACEDTCYDPTVITGPKSFHIQKISTHFDLMGPCHSCR